MTDVVDALHDLVAEDDANISPRALLIALMAEFDGPSGVATELRLNYDACKLGSASSVRIATDLVNAVMKFGDEDGDNEDDAESIRAKVKELLAKTGDDNGE